MWYLKSQLALHIQYSLCRLLQLLSLFISHMNIGHSDHTIASKQNREAEEDVTPIDTIKATSKDSDRVDLALVTEDSASQISNGVANGPRSVTLESNDFIGTANDGLVDVLKGLFLVSYLLLLQKA